MDHKKIHIRNHQADRQCNQLTDPRVKQIEDMKLKFYFKISSKTLQEKNIIIQYDHLRWHSGKSWLQTASPLAPIWHLTRLEPINWPSSVQSKSQYEPTSLPCVQFTVIGGVWITLCGHWAKNIINSHLRWTSGRTSDLTYEYKWLFVQPNKLFQIDLLCKWDLVPHQVWILHYHMKIDTLIQSRDHCNHKILLLVLRDDCTLVHNMVGSYPKLLVSHHQ